MVDDVQEFGIGETARGCAHVDADALGETLDDGRARGPVMRDHRADREAVRDSPHLFVARQAGRKVHVIADRHPVHRSKAARASLEANTDRVEPHLMPGYSPELNPDELLNADLKRNVNASRAHNLDRLAHETRRFLRRRRRQPHLVRSYLRGPHVRYAIM
ncbi:transposase [Saccharothrix lopnurensis]|uniref:Transposase n=1 Tax=Saccharothrix lopnurensis TaxID=1670621 RepID=A0ABW1PAM8_9PSEU